MIDAPRIIAIDYDGTIALDAFPNVGRPNWSVINRALEEKENGTLLILWTCREDCPEGSHSYLSDAVEACSRWGLEFDAINEDVDWSKDFFGRHGRKVYANEYWDDKAIHVNYIV